MSLPARQPSAILNPSFGRSVLSDANLENDGWENNLATPEILDFYRQHIGREYPCQGWITEANTDAIRQVAEGVGDHGWIKHLEVQIRQPNLVGDTLWLNGRMTGRRREGAEALVEIELSATSQRGDAAAVGDATVAMPTRT